MPYLPGVAQDRLVRKEVALGVIRERPLPEQHIGLTMLAPFQNVESDDVIFNYLSNNVQEGLAPARAEDAEAELAQKDESMMGYGRASIIDWAIKDHYSASDVTRYTEAMYLLAAAGGNPQVSFPLTINSIRDGFQEKVARDTAMRRKKLDNRMEWLITQAVETNGVAYNDGKIKFNVAYNRPADQTDEVPPNGLWSATTSDPIRDGLAMQEFMFNRYGVRMTRGICSRRVLNNIMNSDKFTLAATATFPQPNVDPVYSIPGWGPQAAIALFERATGITLTEYDGVYRTRPIGSNTVTTTRFMSDNKVYFLPDQADIDEIDDAIGFGKTLTSPHPEGNWASGYYEWEQETKDPWGRDVGAGIKAFPIFPHLNLTYTMSVL